MLTFKSKTVASITAGLKKTLDELDKLTTEREALAEAKEKQAEDLITEAQADRQEAHHARRVAENLSALLS